ncbi:AAA family ATPase [Apiospora arundinis]|uniref:AAA family ATPase n=1 Tax=Apiospora arundinis TaxID=335852 RepID=A0ABR2JJ92_9PEZI
MVGYSLSSKGYQVDDIGVMSPYTAQVHHLKELAGEIPSLLQIQVGTIDCFQGMQKRAIIYCMTGTRQTGPGFIARRERHIIAVTRATNLLIVVGDRLMDHHFQGLNQLDPTSKDMVPSKRVLPMSIPGDESSPSERRIFGNWMVQLKRAGRIGTLGSALEEQFGSVPGQSSEPAAAAEVPISQLDTTAQPAAAEPAAAEPATEIPSLLQIQVGTIDLCLQAHRQGYKAVHTSFLIDESYRMVEPNMRAPLANFHDALTRLLDKDMTYLGAVVQAKKTDMNTKLVLYYTSPFAPQLETSLPQRMEKAAFVPTSLNLNHLGINSASVLCSKNLFSRAMGESTSEETHREETQHAKSILDDRSVEINFSNGFENEDHAIFIADLVTQLCANGAARRLPTLDREGERAPVLIQCMHKEHVKVIIKEPPTPASKLHILGFCALFVAHSQIFVKSRSYPYAFSVIWYGIGVLLRARQPELPGSLWHQDATLYLDLAFFGDMDIENSKIDRISRSIGKLPKNELKRNIDRVCLRRLRSFNH